MSARSTDERGAGREHRERHEHDEPRDRRARLGWRPRATVFVAIAVVVVVWNALFDYIIRVSTWRFIAIAGAADADGLPLRLSDWMARGVTRAFWDATAAAGIVALAILAVWGLAGRRRAATLSHQRPQS